MRGLLPEALAFAPETAGLVGGVPADGAGADDTGRPGAGVAAGRVLPAGTVRLDGELTPGELAGRERAALGM